METDLKYIKEYLSSFEFEKNRGEEEVKRLRKYRACLLEDIHTQQQCLDSIDYLINEIKKYDKL
ncbi:MAG: hypothetical protein LUD77_11235 [Clostridiales bacterium]|nr:hypothetical protein [Clostridiales bacterium]